MDNYVDHDRDLARRRTIDLGNNKIVIEKKDPFGFWYVHFEKGRVPEHLGGQYTSHLYAEQAVHAYLKDKDRTPVKP